MVQILERQAMPLEPASKAQVALKQLYTTGQGDQGRPHGVRLVQQDASHQPGLPLRHEPSQVDQEESWEDSDIFIYYLNRMVQEAKAKNL